MPVVGTRKGYVALTKAVSGHHRYVPTEGQTQLTACRPQSPQVPSLHSMSVLSILFVLRADCIAWFRSCTPTIESSDNECLSLSSGLLFLISVAPSRDARVGWMLQEAPRTQ
jgi:hypothetical protein